MKKVVAWLLLCQVITVVFCPVIGYAKRGDYPYPYRPRYEDYHRERHYHRDCDRDYDRCRCDRYCEEDGSLL